MWLEVLLCGVINIMDGLFGIAAVKIQQSIKYTLSTSQTLLMLLPWIVLSKKIVRKYVCLMGWLRDDANNRFINWLIIKAYFLSYSLWCNFHSPSKRLLCNSLKYFFWSAMILSGSGLTSHRSKLKFICIKQPLSAKVRSWASQGVSAEFFQGHDLQNLHSSYQITIYCR